MCDEFFFMLISQTIIYFGFSIEFLVKKLSTVNSNLLNKINLSVESTSKRTSRLNYGKNGKSLLHF